MATFTKRGDRWRVEVRAKGVRRAKTFSTKKSAQLWASQVEREIEDGYLGKIPHKTFGELLERYQRDVSCLKAGHIRELKTIDLLLKDEIAQVRLERLSSKDFAQWRDRRLKQVSGSTVCREMNILSHACSVACKEWEWLKDVPTRNVKRPKENPPRTRRPTEEETEQLIHVSGYSFDEPPESVSARIIACYLFAIETAMRAGEIAALRSEHVFERHVHIAKSKNGTKRDVPLSLEAQRILNQVLDVTKGKGYIFGLTAKTIDANFRRLRGRAGIVDLHFHDTRREALTRLSNKLDVMALAKLSGHKDLRILQNVYYAPSISDLADKLD